MHALVTCTYVTYTLYSQCKLSLIYNCVVIRDATIHNSDVLIYCHLYIVIVWYDTIKCELNDFELFSEIIGNK